MKQLKMYWHNNGAAAMPLDLPNDITIKRFSELPNAEQQWLSIIQYMGQQPDPTILENRKLYRESMVNLPYYNEDLCFFLMIDGEAAATITVICDPVKKDGLINMVACKPQYRGRGIGKLMGRIAQNTLIAEGMQTARLATDEWRIPAIKTYLGIGFEPDLTSDPGYATRWDAIKQALQPLHK